MSAWRPSVADLDALDGTVFVRFWDKVSRRGPSDCWEWTAGRKVEGYGRFPVRVGERVVSYYAHRLVWEALNGPIPTGMVICHSCDNPPCCNPAHLWIGTIGDNNLDRDMKGRRNPKGPVGERNVFSKLTEADVRRIRSDSAAGVDSKDLIERYRVSRMTIARIVSRACWKEVMP